jgi:flavin-dependent dehydrogenase
MLADAVFAHPPQALEACGSWLDRPSGDRWIACGDAALAFDPISGQGIFSALYGGMTAGRAVDEALDGGRARLDAYSKRLQDIRRHYVLRCSATYRSEQRWPGERFWSTFSASVDLPEGPEDLAFATTIA